MSCQTVMQLTLLVAFCASQLASCQLTGNQLHEVKNDGDKQAPIEEPNREASLLYLPSNQDTQLNVEQDIQHPAQLQPQLQPQQQQQQQQVDSKLEAAQKCKPMLKLPPASASGNNSQQQASLSFDIGDIDLPVGPQSGSSIDSAMKLLSTFNSQLDLDSSASTTDQGEENMVKFRENQLKIQGLNLSMLNVHLYTDGDPKFGVGINIKNTTITGRFSYKGPLLLSETKLAGYYRMSVENIYLVGSSNLTKVASPLNSSEANSEQRTMFHLVTNELKLNISDFGYISIDIFDSKEANKPTSNYLLRLLQRLLQKTIKRTYFTFENYIRQTLESEARRSLDCELTRFSPMLDTSATSSHRSDLARILAAEIVKSQLNSVALPDFEHRQSVLGTNAMVQFYNGSLSGLDRIKLTGETRIKLQDRHLLVNTSVGWSDLKPYYNWNLFVGSNSVANKSSPVAKGFVMFNIKGIEFDAVMSKGLEDHTRILVDQLVIKRLDGPKMDIGGLPGLNRVTRGMVNFFMGRLKQRLASSIQPALKQQLERALNKITILP